tara:strand:+ start:180 stop:1208 length:1029 start_codon:yes stop_codon:yes gene_type:complete
MSFEYVASSPRERGISKKKTEVVQYADKTHTFDTSNGQLRIDTGSRVVEYVAGEKLGTGSFGVVRVYDHSAKTPDGDDNYPEQIAVKVYKREADRDKWERERDVYVLLSNACAVSVVRGYGIEVNEKLLVVMERGHDLANTIKNHLDRSRPDELYRNVIRDVTSAVQCLLRFDSSYFYVYTDLKTSNCVFLPPDFRVVLADLESVHRLKKTTPDDLAPEKISSTFRFYLSNDEVRSPFNVLCDNMTVFAFELASLCFALEEGRGLDHDKFIRAHDKEEALEKYFKEDIDYLLELVNPITSRVRAVLEKLSSAELLKKHDKPSERYEATANILDVFVSRGFKG